MAASDEKPPTVDNIEDIAHVTPPPDEDEEFTPEEQKKIIKRVDLRLVTMTGLAYCISLMDRTNLSMAAVAGMVEELRLDIGKRYVRASVLTEKNNPNPALLVHHRVDVLRSLCPLSTAYDGYHPQGWADAVPGDDCYDLGGDYDRMHPASFSWCIRVNWYRELALPRTGENWSDCASASVPWKRVTSPAVSIFCPAGIRDVSELRLCPRCPLTTLQMTSRSGSPSST